METESIAVIFNDGKFQGVGNNGQVVPYGKLYFYEAASGNQVDTFTTSTMETKNSFPIILSASGKADVFITDGTFDVTLKDKNDVTVWTINNFVAAGGSGGIAPIYTSVNREDIIGIAGSSIILEETPTTSVNIHKNGLLLNQDEYTLDSKTITFTTPLIVTDEIVAEYGFVTTGVNESLLYGIETMTDLLDADVNSTITANVKGYYAKNDGGGGIFNYDATIDKSTADGGMIIDPDQTLPNQGVGAGNGCWVRQYSGAINIKWFGATGDGITDDLAAFNSAIAFLILNNISLYISTPTAHYKISDRCDVIRGVTNVDIFGNGAKIVVDYTLLNTTIFHISDSSNINIYGLYLKGGHAASTASTGDFKDTIIIGDHTAETTDYLNDNINIYDNVLEGGHHSVVLITGSYGTSGLVKNTNINVYNNKMIDSTSGVFIYKNSTDINVYDNIVYNMGQNGHAADTLSSGDITRPTSEPVKRIVFARNNISKVGISAQGGGIVAKGDIDTVIIKDNILHNVGNVLSTNSMFGILLSRDAADSIMTNIKVAGNTVYDVRNSTTGGWAMTVVEGTSNISITGNTFEYAQRGVKTEGVVNANILNNVFKNLATAAETPLWVGSLGTLGTYTFSGTIANNIFIKESSVAPTAITLDSKVAGCTIGDNDYGTWVAGTRIFTNALATLVSYFLKVVGGNSAAYDPPLLADDATDLGAVLTVAGAKLGDFVAVSFGYTLGGAEITAFVQAANQVRFQITNHSGGAKDLPSSTVSVVVTELISD